MLKNVTFTSPISSSSLLNSGPFYFFGLLFYHLLTILDSCFYQFWQRLSNTLYLKMIKSHELKYISNNKNILEKQNHKKYSNNNF